jgi:diguanylate cyclase (GGDEF)-like protein/PAS domain S-box-containing protein
MIYGAARDITERRQAELELQSTKDQLDLVLQASSEGYWDWNRVTGEIYFSPRWKAMLGYADHELDNSFAMWESVIFAEDHAVALQLIDDYNSGRVDQFSVIQRFYHKDGSTVFVFSCAIHLKNDQGQVVRMVGSHLDITARIEMQAALKTSEMQLSSVLNSSLDGIMAFKSVRDEAGVIVDFEWLLSNPTACKMMGHTADDLIGKRLLVELPGNKTDGLFDLYVQVTESGQPVQRQFHYSHDGFDAWFENIAVQLGDGFAVTFSDITPLKRSQQALQAANQNLESRFDELRQRNDEMQLLGEMSAFLQACLTVEDAYQALGSLIAPLFSTSSGGIFRLNEAGDRVEKVVTWGTQLDSAPGSIPLGCWAVHRGRAPQAAPNCQLLCCTHAAVAASSTTLCLPLLAQGEILGLFFLRADELPPPIQQLARTVVEQVALALANLYLRETLKQQSIRDPLTGLYNRRYLEAALTQEIQRAQRHHHSIGVVMLDIDHFKRVNDTYGHDAGDRVLQAVGQLLRDSVRGSDIACRYGGEEMTLVLPESSLAVTLARAEEIRQAIAILQISYDSHTLNGLSASFGVACFPDHGHNGLAVIKAADASLYQAKAQGRNRVVVAAGPVVKVANGLDRSQISDIS